jgi:magnesium-protoporphyrin IX monomethyl ester (oxidative) cyclase
LALAQLRTVVMEDAGLADRVAITVVHAQHDFAVMLGLPLYRFLADSETALAGEFLFSTVVFPTCDAQAEAYLAQYCPDRVAEMLRVRGQILGFLDRFIAEHGLADADLVAMTSLYQQTMPSLALARRLRALSPDQVIVMGGGNCEGAMGKALIRNFDCLDYVFSGCGLVSFPHFLRSLLQGDRAACDRIDGVFSRANRCDIDWDLAATASAVPRGAVTAPAAAWAVVPQVGLHGRERPVGDVVALDYSDFLDSFDARIKPLAPALKPRLALETSRGCWWGEKSHCTFCGSCGWDISYRQMTPDQAVAYLNDAVARHQGRAVYFECVDQLLPKAYPDEVMPHLALPDDGGLFYEVRTTLSEAHLRRLRDAGVRTIQPGVEALSSSLLKLMAKGVTAAHNLAHLRRCAELGITPFWILLIGLPGEDAGYYSLYRRLLPRLTHLPPPLGVSPIGFHRNSPYTWYPEKYGIVVRPAATYRHIYRLPDAEIADLAYFFDDATPDPAYRRNARRHGPDIGLLVEIWRRAWMTGNGAVPQLHFDRREGRTVVVDTRSGRCVIHALSGAQRALLELLRDPEPVTARPRGHTEADWRAAVTDLAARGLLVEEGGWCVSLVLDAATPTPRFVEKLRRGEIVLH